MSPWKDRLGALEHVLSLPDPRGHISSYHDMPFGIFWYPPTDEFSVRQETTRLATRLEQQGKRVTTVSLAACLADALDREGFTPGELTELERRVGLENMAATIHGVLTTSHPLDGLVLERLPDAPDPLRDIVFINRTGSLFLYYRASALLDQLGGRTDLPTVLFYPGALDEPTGLRFMGLLDPDHNYRPRIY